MREIKFRAFDKTVNKMEFWSMNDGETGFWESAIFDNIYKVMQYTGLKDKNDVEIYEGDIVKRDLGHEAINEIYKVIFEDGSFVTDEIVHFTNNISGKMNIGAFHRNKELEVIGNIYENPELLESK